MTGEIDGETYGGGGESSGAPVKKLTFHTGGPILFDTPTEFETSPNEKNAVFAHVRFRLLLFGVMCM